MERVYKFVEGSINVLMAALLFLMIIFVFGNVVLRYFFNSGWTWAEEMSRFLLVWITFLGAVGAMKENRHLGFSSLIKRMPLPIKKTMFVVSNAVMLCILYLLLGGTWDMTVLGLTNVASATGIPMAYMFGVGLITFSCMIVIVLINTYKALFTAGNIDKLIDLHSEEEFELIEAAKGDEKQ